MDLLDKINLQQIPNNLTKELSTISEYQLFQQSIDEGVSLPQSDNFGAKIEAKARLTINLINDPSDDDQDEVAQKLNYESLLSTKAILNYDLNATINAEASTSNDYFELGFKANQNIIFSYYSVHDNTKNLLDAGTEDVANFKFVLVKNSLLNLGEGRALGMILDGSLEFNAAVNLADTVSASLSSITSIINATDTIKVNFDSSLSISFNAKIEDAFEVLVQKNTGGYHVGLHRSVKRTLTGSIEAKVGIEIENPEVITEAIKKIFDNVEEGIYDKIDPILNEVSTVIKANEDTLNDLVDVAEFLGIKVPSVISVDVIDQLKEKVSEKKEEVESEITKILESKIQLSVGYIYIHTKESKSLFSADMTEQALTDNFSNIILIKTKKLVSAAQQTGSGITNVSYSAFEKIDIKRGLKFGISIGSLSLSLSPQEKFYSRSTSEQFKNGVWEHQLTDFEIGVRRNGNDQDKNDRYSSVQLLLGAGMTQFIPKQDPITPAQLDFEFSMSYARRYKGKVKEHRLRDQLDLAVCIGIITDEEREEQITELNNDYSINNLKRVDFNGNLQVPTGVLDLLIDGIANLSQAELAVIFAEALPYANLNGRMTLSERATTYTSFFMSLLKQGWYNFPVEATLVEELNKAQKRDLAHFESGQGNWGKYQEDRAFVVIRKDDFTETFGQNRFLGSFKALQEGMHQNYLPVVQSKAFQKGIYQINLGGLALEVYNLRIMARLICHLAEKNQVTDKLQRSFEIKLPKKINNVDTVILGDS